jgi:pyruvate/2-oxoglutarate dehydrogenase complex dihydrolipoamide acyltransferase (E2) component
MTMPEVTVTLPKLGDTADSVVVLEWLAEPGAPVVEGDPLLRVETAKVEVDIPAPCSGVLARQLVGIDAEVSLGTALAVITTE